MFGTVWTALVVFVALLPNVFLDVRLRKVSETILVAGGLGMVVAMALTEHWFGVVVSGFAALILTAVFARSATKGGTGWGDVEMIALLALGFGALSFFVVLFALILARSTARWWPLLAASTTPRPNTAPMAVYFAVASAVFLALKLA